MAFSCCLTFLLVVYVSFDSEVAAEIPLGRCSLSCGETSLPTDARYTEGRRGKSGQKGEKGAPGPACECAAFDELTGEIGLLKQELAELKRSSCPYPYNGYSYKLTRVARTWQASRDYCQKLGGDLAAVGMKNRTMRRMITSYLERDVTTYVWIGATDARVEGEWRWVDGSMVGSAVWLPGQPDDYRVGQDCGVLRAELFDDGGCAASFRAVCEFKLPAGVCHGA